MARSMLRKSRLSGRVGRPSDLTPDLSAIICQLVQLGSTHEVAARAAGVNVATFYRWKQWGRERPDSIYAQFCEALDQAEAEGEVRHLDHIAGSGVTGSMWILQRRHPERWADTQRLRVEMDRRADEMLDALKEGLSDDEFGKVLAVLAGGGAAGG